MISQGLILRSLTVGKFIRWLRKGMVIDMNDWKEKLAAVDDDYLIGISNKGIVKRAYKDKQESAAEILGTGEEAAVKVGGETVTVCFPLGESRCTCPSRSICRHVIQAILTLREGIDEVTVPTEQPGQSGQSEQSGQPGQSGQSEQTVQSGQSGQSEQTVQSGQSGQSEQTEQPGQSEQSGQSGQSGQSEQTVQPGQSEQAETLRQTGDPEERETFTQPEPHKPTASDKVCREIDEYPVPVLRKTLGVRQFQSFVGQVLSGVRPQIRYTSVVTVRLPDSEAGAETVVRLLSPLEYSSCTCHKKELCVHKAAAILWCKLESGILTGEELKGGAAGEMTYDMDSIRAAAGQMKLFLEELLGTGLSRTSPDVLDHMERLAVISHNAGLARFEGYFRGLFDSYGGYFKRKAAFKTEDLMGQITRLYRRVRLLQQARDSAEVRQYAGEFRAEYIPVGRLELIGIAAEHFDSGTGYEGETVYFLEENTKRWYTYTNARPVFYETRKKKKFTEKGQAPWGLGITMEDLTKVRIRLTGAKCDERGRISASQDTRGEVTGERKLSLSDIEGWYYSDFGKLFAEQIGKRRKEWLVWDSSQEAAELVFVQPASCEPADFSQAKQQLSLPLYDGEEREVVIEVTYSKEESGTIRYLERISEKRLPCFVGKIYLKDGRLRMYPVAVQEHFS